ncbi:hypothetical protein C8F04DRAFT_1253123 [Mycena alexandri]|uniref:Uncharacterized protein n=1 Tax=Mycena alexandri TaxID=1745969 RepID=A0AAD6T7U9_9AGAR|nr:hypothetical protein C8F04DRAFT_1253123 [Mycena alexandri]
MPEQTLSFYQGMAVFLFDLLAAGDGIAICSALVSESAGLAKPLTSACMWHEICSQTASHKASDDAIAAGLLYAVVRSLILCPDAGGPEDPTALWDMLTVTSPAATAYHNVLVELESQMNSVE